MSVEAAPMENRRPIAVRRWPIFHWLAGLLAGLGISPNAVSVAGMLCGIGAGGMLAATSWLVGWELRLAWLAGVLLIQLRLLANLLDGMVAVEFKKASPVGELYNEVPDRISDVVTLIGAGYAIGGDPALGYLAACVALFTAYVRAMSKAAGAPNDFRGPMAKQQRMFTVTIVAIYCGFAPLDWQPLLASRWGLIAVGLTAIIVLGMATALRRLWHASQFLSNHA